MVVLLRRAAQVAVPGKNRRRSVYFRRRKPPVWERFWATPSRGRNGDGRRDRPRVGGRFPPLRRPSPAARPCHPRSTPLRDPTIPSGLRRFLRHAGRLRCCRVVIYGRIVAGSTLLHAATIWQRCSFQCNPSNRWFFTYENTSFLNIFLLAFSVSQNLLNL